MPRPINPLAGRDVGAAGIPLDWLPVTPSDDSDNIGPVETGWLEAGNGLPSYDPVGDIQELGDGQLRYWNANTVRGPSRASGAGGLLLRRGTKWLAISGASYWLRSTALRPDSFDSYTVFALNIPRLLDFSVQDSVVGMPDYGFYWDATSRKITVKLFGQASALFQFHVVGNVIRFANAAGTHAVQGTASAAGLTANPGEIEITLAAAGLSVTGTFTDGEAVKFSAIPQVGDVIVNAVSYGASENNMVVHWKDAADKAFGLAHWSVGTRLQIDRPGDPAFTGGKIKTISTTGNVTAFTMENFTEGNLLSGNINVHGLAVRLSDPDADSYLGAWASTPSDAALGDLLLASYANASTAAASGFVLVKGNAANRPVTTGTAAAYVQLVFYQDQGDFEETTSMMAWPSSARADPDPLAAQNGVQTWVEESRTYVATSLMVGATGGSLKVKTAAGNDRTFTVGANQVVPGAFLRVYATGTTATTIHAGISA